MGNVYMEADQVRFKDSTYRNVQEGLAAALEGGGGGGTTVVANPEGSATADLAKLQVGTTIYGIPAEAGDISYDNTSSGLTADDVQEAIDELTTGLSSVTELIPSGATSSNMLATASDIPDAVTGNPSGSATAGNLTKLQIGSDIYNVPSGGSNAYGIFSDTETAVGSWYNYTLYRKIIPIGALPDNTMKQTQAGVPSGAKVRNIYGVAVSHTEPGYVLPLPYCAATNANNIVLAYNAVDDYVEITTGSDRTAFDGYVILEYFKIS